MRARGGLRQLALRIAGVVVLAGAATMLGASPATAQEVTSPPSAQLSIVYTPDPSEGAYSTWSLTCDPAGGTHWSPKEACKRIAELDDPFAPVPPDVFCLQVFYGPERAYVSGTVNGESIDTEFSRHNSCANNRWNEHAAIIDPPPVWTPAG